jgi:hypothetical protein
MLTNLRVSIAIPAFEKANNRNRVESDRSKKLEADIAAGWDNSPFRKSPASVKAEDETVGVPSLSFRMVSIG